MSCSRARASPVPPRALLEHPGQLAQRPARVALAAQLVDHAGDAGLVQLVHGDEDLAHAVGREATALDQGREQPPVVHPDLEAGQAQLGERRGGGLDEFDLRQLGGVPQHVDVALRELAVAPALRTVRAPHRPDLDRPEGLGQLPRVGGVEARQGHGQVVAQAQQFEVSIIPLTPYILFMLT